MSYHNAEALLRKRHATVSAWQKFPSTTLESLCRVNGLKVKSTGLRPKGSARKQDYVNAILEFVSVHGMIRWSNCVIHVDTE